MRWSGWMRSAGAVVVMTLAISGFARAGAPIARLDYAEGAEC